jgi:hypothetical protein
LGLRLGGAELGSDELEVVKWLQKGEVSKEKGESEG